MLVYIARNSIITFAKEVKFLSRFICRFVFRFISRITQIAMDNFCQISGKVSLATRSDRSYFCEILGRGLHQ